MIIAGGAFGHMAASSKTNNFRVSDDRNRRRRLAHDIAKLDLVVHCTHAEVHKKPTGGQSVIKRLPRYFGLHHLGHIVRDPKDMRRDAARYS